MHRLRKVALLGSVLALAGCRPRMIAPEHPLPPNTVLLSAMMRELSAHPGFTEAVLKELDGARNNARGKKGPALLTPRLIDELRRRVLGKDWQALDRFPGWTMREINPTVRLASDALGRNTKLEGMSAVHPGAAALSDTQARVFLDLGPYKLDEAQTVSLDAPSTLPGFTTDGIVTPLGMDVVRGDGPNDLAPEHAASQRLADVLNRLASNGLTDARPFTAIVGGHAAATPQELVAALISAGHTVTVTDSRYFANFGHLHYKGQDVMMPFWVNTELAVPGSGDLFHRPRPLLVPVSHAEYEWHIRGPHMNADVSHYFGVDGKAEWRTMDTLDQAWVGKRDAHTYTDGQAVEVTRLIAAITVAYMHEHADRPTLPFGGYYTLGVCQDVVSAVEKRMTGRSTLFPNTADSALFNDPRDTEANALFAAIPKDRAGAAPQPERIFGSLPSSPDADGHFNAITIPGLSDDLNVSYAAWRRGELKHTHRQLFYTAWSTGLSVFAFVALGLWMTGRRARVRGRLPAS